MKNCGFRNAVIGRNKLADPVWPVLNESNCVLKRRHRLLDSAQRNPVNLVDNDHTFKYLPSSSRENDHFASRFSSAEVGGGSPIENNFPELSKSFKIQKDLNTVPVKKSSNYKFDTKKLNKNGQSSRRIRIPKFRSEINVSLSSLIKLPVVKNKLLPKKRNLNTSVLCGNKLDSDRPIRKKGKSRLVKRNHLTQHKKNIILSRTLKNKGVYNKEFHKLKCLIPLMLKNFNTEKLETLLGSLHIEELKNEHMQCNNECPISTKDIAKTLLHSKKFKKYCDNLVTPTLLNNVENLVVRLRNLQDKQHAKDPSKTFAKRRYLCGFRETKRFISCDSVKAVIIATDLEMDSDLPSGLLLNEVKELAERKSIPIIFAGSVKQLRYWTIKKQKISILSILRYEGAEQLYNDVIQIWEESKKAYENIIRDIENCIPRSVSSEEEISQDVEQEIRDNIISKLSTEIIGLEENNK